MSNQILTPDRPDEPDCSDFTLQSGSCWITVGNLSVYIVDRGDGVFIEVLPVGEEADMAIDSLVVVEEN